VASSDTAAPAARLFPVIRQDLYAAGVQPDGGEQPSLDAAIRGLLDLSRERLGTLQRCAGWGLRGRQRISRLLMLHRLALEAELAGRWTRADLFWDQTLRAFQKTARDDRGWETVFAELFADNGQRSVVGSGTDLRNRVAAELLIDAHVALFQAYAQSESNAAHRDRARCHATWAERYLGLGLLPEDVTQRILGSFLLTKVELLKKAEDWTAAITALEEAIDRFPSAKVHRGYLAMLYFQRALQRLSNRNTESASQADANELADSIRAAEQAKRRHDPCCDFYDLLGALHHLRAIKLANAGLLSSALVEVEKALVYHPGSGEAEQTAQKLAELMTNLQHEAAGVSAALKLRPGATLSQDGWRLVEESNRGFTAAKRYRESEEASRLAEQRAQAAACRLWTQIGLAEPAQDWGRRALHLQTALMGLLDLGMAGGDVASAWSELCQHDPELAELDSSAICAFLERVLHRQTDDAPAGDANRDQSQAAATVALDLSALRPRFSIEPPGYWAFSRRDLAWKAASCAAVLLLLAAAAAWGYDRLQRDRRDGAFEQLLAAASQQNALSAEQHGRAFLAAEPLLAQDPREEAVAHYLELASHGETWRRREAAYSELKQAVDDGDAKAIETAADAFLAALPDGYRDQRKQNVEEVRDQAEALQRRRARDRAYQDLGKAREEGNHFAVLLAAEKFLEAEPTGEADPREPQLLEWYNETFTDWMLGQHSALDADSELRIARFRALIDGRGTEAAPN
jgi:hypothetical protein